jgi:hypothetical protein
LILRITQLELVGRHVLRLAFNTGVRKAVDVLPLLDGLIFEPLRDPTFFARAKMDPVTGTAVWPNGADLAPEALFDLHAIDGSGAP